MRESIVHYLTNYYLIKERDIINIGALSYRNRAITPIDFFPKFIYQQKKRLAECFSTVKMYLTFRIAVFQLNLCLWKQFVNYIFFPDQ